MLQMAAALVTPRILLLQGKESAQHCASAAVLFHSLLGALLKYDEMVSDGVSNTGQMTGIAIFADEVHHRQLW